MPTAIIDITGWAAPAASPARHARALSEWQFAALQGMLAQRELVWIDDLSRPGDEQVCSIDWNEHLGQRGTFSPSKRLSQVLVIARVEGSGIAARRRCAQQMWTALLRPLMQTPEFAHCTAPALRVRLLYLDGQSPAGTASMPPGAAVLSDPNHFPRGADDAEGEAAFKAFDEAGVQDALMVQAKAALAGEPAEEQKSPERFSLGELGTHPRDQPVLQRMLQAWTERINWPFLEGEDRTDPLGFLEHLGAVPVRDLRERWKEHAISLTVHARGLPGLEVQWNRASALPSGHRMTVEMLHLPARHELPTVEQDLRRVLAISTLLDPALDLEGVSQVQSKADGQGITLKEAVLELDVDVETALAPWRRHATGLQDFIDGLSQAGLGLPVSHRADLSEPNPQVGHADAGGGSPDLKNEVKPLVVSWLTGHEESQLSDTQVRALQEQSAHRELAVQRVLDKAPGRLASAAMAAQARAAAGLQDRHAVAQLKENRDADFECFAAEVMPPLPVRPDASFWALKRLRLRQLLARRVRWPALARVAALALASLAVAHLPGMMVLRPTASSLYVLPPALWLASLCAVGALGLWAMHRWHVQGKIDALLEKAEAGDLKVHHDILARDEKRTGDLASLIGRQAALKSFAERAEVRRRQQALAAHYRQVAERHLEGMRHDWSVNPAVLDRVSVPIPVAAEGVSLEELLSKPPQPPGSLEVFRLPLLREGYDGDVCGRSVKVAVPGLINLRVGAAC